MAPGHTHDPLEWCPDVLCLPARLRAEAEVARTSNRGQHPKIRVMTHAAALRHAANIVEQSLPQTPHPRECPNGMDCYCYDQPWSAT